MPYDVLAYNVVFPVVRGPGQALIQLSGAPAGQVWRVTGLTVASTVSPEPEALIYDQALPGAPGDLAPEWNVCTPVPAQGTKRGGLDFDDQNSYLLIPGGATLSILWLVNGGGSPLELTDPSQICGARVQYEVAQLSSSQSRPVLT